MFARSTLRLGVPVLVACAALMGAATAAKADHGCGQTAAPPVYVAPNYGVTYYQPSYQQPVYTISNPYPSCGTPYATQPSVIYRSAPSVSYRRVISTNSCSLPTRTYYSAPRTYYSAPRTCYSTPYIRTYASPVRYYSSPVRYVQPSGFGFSFSYNHR